MRRFPADLAHALAGEYVVGTLRGGARRRFETSMREDAQLTAIVHQWEAELVPLSLNVPGVDPPKRVWRAIRARIQVQQSARPRRPALPWQFAAFACGAAAAALFGAVLWLLPAYPVEPIFVAVLIDPQSVPHAVVSMQSPDVLRVRMTSPVTLADDQDLELWVIPATGAPRSLGVMPKVPGDTVIHILPTDPRVVGAKALAMSVEPRGGSPTKLPTGAVVLSGPIAPTRST